MILQQTDLNDITTWILLLVAIILVALFLYIATRLIAGKKNTDTGYIIRLLLVAVIIVLLVAVVIGAIIGAINNLDPIDVIAAAATQLVPVLIYLAIVYLIKFFLIPEKGEVTKWSASIWIAVITLFLIYLFNIIVNELFDTVIISV